MPEDWVSRGRASVGAKSGPILRKGKRVKRRDLRYSRSNPRCFQGFGGGDIPDNVNVLMEREVIEAG
jgi:hypothetical protein